ncbi:hypothetical protein TVAG_151290 [Trichomonas vaginalis G3]|uniref:RING-type domain-containing protein n=1 Tax=Trichomonas vaginalis (strain ATCC PRA-98 / G3) TaxID=412133 RepID=A2EQC6_TRIV3|nr:RING finger and transmembrane domain-containing protein 1/2 family [Trichomonas vaginalis G3]EAY05142.1 hypothetical protein TVAG_151290 [Trichomonas vaginalis G3]KAI5510955.1 RING finger and transmembrane domain-containing protein 1/2 family [Trichomonas vaginalis G3]|eukprot:XP_001317365.1 hypothetical protein [Trichomonas vaginalis G3]
MKCYFLLWLLWDLVSALKKYKINSEVALKPAPKEKLTDPCIICMNDIIEGVQLDCGDVFCYDCAKKWLSINPTCPICRAHVKTEMKMEFCDGFIPLSVLFCAF